MLLYGIVAYAAGRLGQEPPRSQGHVHAIAPHSGWSPPEVFQILRRPTPSSTRSNRQRTIPEGVSRSPPARAKRSSCRRAGRTASSMPTHRRAWSSRPGATGSTALSTTACADTAAWPGSRCSTRDNRIRWQPNPSYRQSKLTCHDARQYPELELDPSLSLYEQFLHAPDSLMYVPEPSRKAQVWENFVP